MALPDNGCGGERQGFSLQSQMMVVGRGDRRRSHFNPRCWLWRGRGGILISIPGAGCGGGEAGVLMPLSGAGCAGGEARVLITA